MRDIDALVQEAVGLAVSIDLEVRHAEALTLRKTRPATLIGTGHLERLHGIVHDLGIGVVVVDGALMTGQSPASAPPLADALRDVLASAA